MSLVYPQPEVAGEGPQTHVLAIGVGWYPHLSGGTSPNPKLPPMGQLTSAPRSARALADWCIATMHNPAAPLGSVDLLLSEAAPAPYVPPRPGATPVTVEHATLDGIRKAMRRWFKRCHRHRDNVCVLYFCGHGVQKSVTYLLPEDIGASDENEWYEAIHFNGNYDGMAGCAARNQFYFIDACRQTTSRLLATTEIGGHVFITGSVWEQGARVAPILGTAKGLAAFGEADELTRYGRILLAALNGGGAEKRDGAWLIDSSLLGPAMGELFDDDNRIRPTDDQQVFAVWGESVGVSVINVLAQPPRVRARICCAPSNATDHAEFLIGSDGVTKYERVPAAPGVWQPEVEAGVYDVSARFQSSAFRAGVRTKEVFMPPIHDVTVPVR